MPFRSNDNAQEPVSSFNQVNSLSVEPAGSAGGSGATVAPDAAKDSVILDLRQRLETERRNLYRLEQHLLQANIDAGRAEDDARDARRQHEVIRAPNGEIAYVSASSRTRLEEAISFLTSRYIGVREALRHAP